MFDDEFFEKIGRLADLLTILSFVAALWAFVSKRPWTVLSSHWQRKRGAFVPQRLILLVARHHPWLYRVLKTALTNVPGLDVVLDRRLGERRQQVVPPRVADRRTT